MAVPGGQAGRCRESASQIRDQSCHASAGNGSSSTTWPLRWANTSRTVVRAAISGQYSVTGASSRMRPRSTSTSTHRAAKGLVTE